VSRFEPKEFLDYAILKRIGSGGMSDVYEGMQRRLGRRVAIKIRRPHKPEHEQKLRDRFVQSIRLHSSIAHPNIVRVIDLVHEHDADAAILEFLAGPTLEERLKSKGRLELSEVLRVGRDIGDAMGHIHAQGIVHRDVKPSNMMYADADSFETLKLMDFGVAKGSDVDGDLTVKGAQIGTLWYMCPEQLSGHSPQPAWDVFALGVSLAELWVGRLPLQERSQSAVFRRHLDAEPIPGWSSAHRRISASFCDMLEAMLEIDPNRRLKDLVMVRCLIQALLKTHTPASSEGGSLKRLSEEMVRRNLAGLSEAAALRLKRLLAMDGSTQEVTVSLNRTGFQSVSGAAELDDTITTDLISDD
jgi:eukaryotic-like serine/threonine-protein kinase